MKAEAPSRPGSADIVASQPRRPRLAWQTVPPTSWTILRLRHHTRPTRSYGFRTAVIRHGVAGMSGSRIMHMYMAL